MENANAVALAALGVLATSVGLMAWVVKKVLGDVAPALTKHAETAEKLSDAVDKNSAVSTEMFNFMKNLNGKLSKATIQTVKEQHIEHQTVVN